MPCPEPSSSAPSSLIVPSSAYLSSSIYLYLTRQNVQQQVKYSN